MMDNQLSGEEVIEMAKKVEERGQRFYRKHAQKSEDEELKTLFEKLASDEEDHFYEFETLKRELLKETEEVETFHYDPETSAYIEALTEFSVFDPVKEIDEEFETIHDVIKLAIQTEKDSILLYQEMVEYNEGKTVELLKRLIKQEKEHLLDLVKYEAEII